MNTGTKDMQSQSDTWIYRTFENKNSNGRRAYQNALAEMRRDDEFAFCEGVGDDDGAEDGALVWILAD